MNFLLQPVKSTRRLIVLAAWLLFSISLASWLYIFSSQQVEQLALVLPDYAEELARHQRMLLWETSTLLFCLVAGGVVLAWYINRDVQQSNNLREFFLNLSHELKTAIASLHLQAEFITSELENTAQAKLLNQLSKDVARLSFQLENSLYLANSSRSDLLLENVDFNSALELLQIKLPELSVSIPKESIFVKADKRALDSILLNLGFNAIKHGNAKNLQILINAERHYWQVEFIDDGTGFNGNFELLGKVIQRPFANSGSGIGLFLACSLACRIGGKLEFLPVTKGFKAKLTLAKAT